MAFEYAKVMKELNSESSKFYEATNKFTRGKGFIAFRRFLSGSWAWAPVNKMMGVINIYQKFHKDAEDANKALVDSEYESVSKDFLGRDIGGLFGNKKGLGLDPVIDMQSIKMDIGPGGVAEIPEYQRTVDALGGGRQAENDAIMLLMETMKPLAKQAAKQEKMLVRQVEYMKEGSAFTRWQMKMKHKMTDAWEGIKENALPFAKFLGKGLAVLLILPIIAFTIWKLFKKTEETRKFLVYWFGLIKLGIMNGITHISDGFSKITEAFEEGSIFKLLHGLVLILFGLGKILYHIVVGILGALLWGGFILIVENLDRLIDEQKEKKTHGVLIGLKIITYIGSIAALLATLVFIFTGGGFVAIMISALTAAFLAVASFAHAGGTKSGLTVVGEKGPELVNLPGGSRVYSNNQSKSMAGGNTINVHVNGRVGASDAEIRDIANKVGQQINLRMNRTSATGTGF